MSKKIRIWLLLLFLTGFLIPQPAMGQTAFTDIGSNWAKDSITELAGLGYVHGYSDNTFRPDQPMTRAEFTTALLATAGIQTDNASGSSFSDTGSHWARAQINTAVKKGILIPSEYPGGLKPDGNIVRSEVAAMAVRALGKQADTGSLPPFTDKTEVAKSMYSGYIKTAFDLKLLSGYTGGSFKPFNTITRAEVAKVLCNFIDQKQAVGTTPGTGASGTIDSIQIGGQTYALASTPFSFEVGYTVIPVSSITYSPGYIQINGKYSFALNASSGNPYLILNNERYTVDKLTVSGSALQASVSSPSLATVTRSDQKYTADFVKLYINGANQGYYLSDMELVDETRVKIGGNTYDLGTDKITIALGDDYYDIEKINYDSAGTYAELDSTDAVILDGLSKSDISAIFCGDSSLSPSDIGTIYFFIDGTRYKMSEVVLDTAGKFTVGRNLYDVDDVKMVIDGTQYQIRDIERYNGKFIFYCDEGSDTDWVVIDDSYYTASQVEIIKDGTAYDMDDVGVVSKNILRIKGKQYDLDSSFKCRYGGKTYDIDEIEYSSKLDAVEIETGDVSDSETSYQPDQYVFYKGDSVYRKGADDDVKLYTGKKWVFFDEISIPDPAHFTYDGTNYILIGSQVEIDDDNFTITDTAWRGLSQELDIYLKKL